MRKEDVENLNNSASRDKWNRMGLHKRAGILIPLFSVYSKNSTGIGDFADLKLLADLCGNIGVSILQLLPMNETGSTNCPYDAVSSFALEPAYISLESLPSAKKRSTRTKINNIKKSFPAGKPNVDYGIKEAKINLLLDIYMEEKNRSSADYKKFAEDNGYWLDDFALFKVLKYHHNGRPWYEWDEAYAVRDTVSLGVFCEEHKKEIAFQKWVQWICHSQFKDAASYAHSKGVKICGDLPILTSRDSSDVWAHPEFFKLDFAAGAPPDMYCAKGQRWGMPTYNWEAVESDGYSYIKEKLRYSQEFYDILRIDHVVGLFRIWSIPYDNPFENEGLNGFFDPQDEKTWPEHGKDILSVMLENTEMLLCGEDLGMIPKSCPETLKEFGIPGNDVQRWVKDWQTTHDFLEPREYRLFSIAMLSTHDTTNWPAWWENEAGTVDEALFIRKCRDRGIDYDAVKTRLFNNKESRHGRLRWLDSVESLDSLIAILGKRREELADFIELYENTYREKEKLWKHLKLKGKTREKYDPEILAGALKITLSSRSVYCIENLIDYMFLDDIFGPDPYKYRINRPGTVSKDNWSLVIPMPLEDILKHKICISIKDLIVSSDRI